MRTQARKEAEDGLKLKVMEKDHTIASMQKKIEELKRRPSRVHSKCRARSRNWNWKTCCAPNFPSTPSSRCQRANSAATCCIGSSARAAKPVAPSSGNRNAPRTGATAGWPSCAKTSARRRRSYRSSSARHFPKGVETFDVIDGVWVVTHAALPVATVLRHTLLQVSMARQVSEGQQTKTEMIYQYLTGPRFRHRVEAIVEAFSSMQEDLDKERRPSETVGQARGADRAGDGGDGRDVWDLQGIAGKSLQEIEGLELKAIGLDDNDD